MTGCWVRTWGDDDGFEWSEPEPVCPGEFYVSDNEVVATLLGPTGDVISQMYEREPIGYRPGRY